MEIWKDIEGYEGLYQVSNKGRIKSFKKKFGTQPTETIMKQTATWCGYIRIKLIKDNKGWTPMVHRLVAKAFIPNPENKPVINHKDGNRANNDVENLEWVTYKENANLSKKLKATKRYNSIIVRDSCGNKFDSYRQAGRFWGLSPNTIKNDCKKKTKGYQNLTRKVRFWEVKE